MLDGATFQPVKSIEWSQDFPELNLLDYHVSNEFMQFVYKNKREQLGPEVIATGN
jgi:hypothetical protein